MPRRYRSGLSRHEKSVAREPSAESQLGLPERKATAELALAVTNDQGHRSSPGLYPLSGGDKGLRSCGPTFPCVIGQSAAVIPWYFRRRFSPQYESRRRFRRRDSDAPVFAVSQGLHGASQTLGDHLMGSTRWQHRGRRRPAQGEHPEGKRSCTHCCILRADCVAQVGLRRSARNRREAEASQRATLPTGSSWLFARCLLNFGSRQSVPAKVTASVSFSGDILLRGFSCARPPFSRRRQRPSTYGPFRPPLTRAKPPMPWPIPSHPLLPRALAGRNAASCRSHDYQIASRLHSPTKS